MRLQVAEPLNCAEQTLTHRVANSIDRWENTHWDQSSLLEGTRSGICSAVVSSTAMSQFPLSDFTLFCRSWSQQQQSWNTAEGLFIPVTQHHGWFQNRCLGFLCPSFMQSSHAGSAIAPVSPARSQVALLGTASASWLSEPFHFQHSSSQTTPIQSARPQEACAPKLSVLLHLLQLLRNQRVDD